MLRIGKCLILISITYGAVFAQNQPADFESIAFRELRDRDFQNPEYSPLLPSDLAVFQRLSYFDFDSQFRVNASFERSFEKKTFLMPTSSGKPRKYLKMGDLRFKLAGIDVSISAFVYQWAPDHPKSKEEVKEVFVPFRDATNGSETYSAGRHLYVRLPTKDNQTVVDFNLAYNPSCAYGDDSYVCALPPKENFLQVEIKAGEKVFKRVEKNSK